MTTCPPPSSTSTAQAAPEVEEAANLLEGRSMVLIGGDRRLGTAQALKDAFRLSDLIWIETREHQPTADFAPYVARPDAALVMLAICWSSHSYGNVKADCDKHGKPLVRLPAGYSPNQVAAQIMSPCSKRLKASS